MRSVRITLLSLSLAGALPVLGCNASEPSALPDNYSQMPDMRKPPGAGDNKDLLPPDDGRVDPPRLDAPIRLTEWMSVPVNGTAEPGTSVLIEGTASGTISADVSTDGRFCANVKLRANMVNALSLRTVDGIGNLSDKVDLAIRQEGAPPAPAAAPLPQNAAIGGSGSSAKLMFTRNDEDALIDNDRASSYGGRHQPFTSYALMTVRLASRSRINKIVLTAPEDCPFTAPFELYYSNEDAPSSVKVNPMGWTKVVPTSQDESQATLSLTSATIATHVSIVWPYDGWSSAGLNCGSWVAGPYYAVSEVQAWTVPNVAPPPPSPPSCTGGGL
jgi:hypothetical protein